MSQANPKILVTAAGGQLGRLVLAQLLKSVPADRIVAGARHPDSLKEFAARGVTVRAADYGKPATLDAALAGIDRFLLISSNSVGARASEHKNAIDAAKRAGVSLLAYTSILRCDTTPIAIGDEHKITEAALKASGVPHVLLRNGWYTENYTGAIQAILAHNAVVGSSGNGKVSGAARADYAAAAAAVLTASENQAGKVYELAGDEAFTMAELAAEIARQSGKPIAYNDVPEAVYAGILTGAGLPEGFAKLLAQSSTVTKDGALFDDSHTMSKLIGRKTTPMKDVVAAALKV
ncbi:MAG TPA: SDR family oxidoreductase [Dongiaceae bacterium]|jgi:NAD(P)H dehydrogenase (quinone)|nr:SDR family oxidoreductase [Dongiaceae bacterium]